MVMAESVDMLMQEFLSWVAARHRTYDEAMEAERKKQGRKAIGEILDHS